VFLKQGPYGHYVQIGEDKKGLFPKRASLSKVKDIDSVTLEDAIELLQYPKILGKHPEDDYPVLITHSKVGYNINAKGLVQPLAMCDKESGQQEQGLVVLAFGVVKYIQRQHSLLVNGNPAYEFYFYFLLIALTITGELIHIIILYGVSEEFLRNIAPLKISLNHIYLRMKNSNQEHKNSELSIAQAANESCAFN
ncbi:hypothetical protein ACJX0J_036878, partial [Zea mays]